MRFDAPALQPVWACRIRYSVLARHLLFQNRQTRNHLFLPLTNQRLPVLHLLPPRLLHFRFLLLRLLHFRLLYQHFLQVCFPHR